MRAVAAAILAAATLAAALMTGCAETRLATTPRADVPAAKAPVSLTAHPSDSLPEIEYTIQSMDLPLGSRGWLEYGPGCSYNRDLPMSWTGELEDAYFTYVLTTAFVDTLRNAGYRATALESDDFRPVSPTLQTAATLVDLRMNTCVRGAFSSLRSQDGEAKAEAFIGVRWAIFDKRSGRIVYKGETGGSARQAEFAQGNNEKAIADAFAAATQALLAIPEVRSILSDAPAD